MASVAKPSMLGKGCALRRWIASLAMTVMRLSYPRTANALAIMPST